MNWIRFVIRAVASFVVIFLLGYIVPGFSGFTYTHLLISSILVALAASLADMALRPESRRQRSIILFVASAVVIYLYSIIAVDVRPPLASTLLAGVAIGFVDWIFPEHPREERKEEIQGENNQNNQ